MLLRTRALAWVSRDDVRLHRLVQLILRSRPAKGAAGSDIASLAVRLLRAAVPPDPGKDPATRQEWFRLLPHVRTATDASRGLHRVGGDVAWLLDRAAAYLRVRGKSENASPLLQDALDLRRRAHELMCQVLGEDHRDTLFCAGNLAAYLRALGRHGQAYRFQEDTWISLCRVLGEDDPDTLDAAGHLAADLRNLERHEQACRLNEDILSRRRRVLGEDHRDTLTAANNLAMNLRALGNYEKALQLDEDTFTRSCRVLGADDPDTHISATNLAADLRALGLPGRARQFDEGAWPGSGRGPVDEQSRPRMGDKLIAVVRRWLRGGPQIP